MFCQQCGAANPDDATSCSACSAPLFAPTWGEPAKPPAADDGRDQLAGRDDLAQRDDAMPSAAPAPAARPRAPAQAERQDPLGGFDEQNPYTTPATTGGPGVGGMHGEVPSHLGLAITATVVSALSMMCCCPTLPLGIISIVYASQVSGKLAAGDLAGARNASRIAKLLAIIALAVTLGLGAIVAVINVAQVLLK